MVSKVVLAMFIAVAVTKTVLNIAGVPDDATLPHRVGQAMPR
jgi:hypothetical protein